jgi:hypothetical protein
MLLTSVPLSILNLLTFSVVSLALQSEITLLTANFTALWLESLLSVDRSAHGHDRWGPVKRPNTEKCWRNQKSYLDTRALQCKLLPPASRSF